MRDSFEPSCTVLKGMKLDCEDQMCKRNCQTTYHMQDGNRPSLRLLLYASKPRCGLTMHV